MKFLDRVRRGLVGATLLAAERGAAEAVTVRARPSAPREGAEEVSVTTPREDLDVGLPVGETDLEDLLAEADMKHVFGVSMQEMRYMAGIPDAFGKCRFDPAEVNFEDVEFYRAVRTTPPTALGEETTRRAIVDAVERAGVEAPSDEFRVFGRNHRPR